MTVKKQQKVDDIVCFACGQKLSDTPNAVFVKLRDDKDVYLCSECIADIYDKVMASDVNDKQNQNPFFDFSDDTDDELEENDTIANKKNKNSDLKIELSTPEKIRKHLDQYIIGQEEAKKIISVAAYNHYKTLLYDETHYNENDIEISKSNLIMVGPSGAGKTEIIRALSKVMDVPLAIADASGLSKSGYVGMDPVSILSDLLYRSGNNVEAAETGIVYIDEFDKLAKRKDDNTAKDVTGEGVQQELLKILEGNVVEVPLSGAGRRMNSETVRVDTSKILFICGGAFDGIEDIIRDRIAYKNKKPTMGFGDTSAKSGLRDKEYNELIVNVTTEDLNNFGIIPEMLGRLPIICPLKQLTQEQLVEILTKPKNAIVKQFKEMLKMDKAELVFTKTALGAIAKDAIERKTGARGLRSIIEKLLTDTMYTVPSMNKRVRITFNEKCITENKKPVIKEIVNERKTKNYAN